MNPENLTTNPPAVPNSLPDPRSWRDDVADELERLLDDELIPEDTRKEMRAAIVEAINARIDIPIIGEAVEAAIIRFLVGLTEKVVARIARSYAGKILDGVRG